MSQSPSARRELIRKECERRGIKIIERGRTFHLVGPGVDIVVVDLATLTVDCLAPHLVLDWKAA